MRIVYNKKADCLYRWVKEEEFHPYDQLHNRCREDKIREILKLLPQVSVISAEHYNEGNYEEPGHSVIHNLPEFYLIRLEEDMGDGIKARLKVFLPVCWNERFMGMTGAASYTEFSAFALAHTNMVSWPIALVNGFACATTDGGIGIADDFKWGFDEKGSVMESLIDSWNIKATHDMTMIAKILITILYGKAPRYSYIHGGSGGGKQVLAEVQNYPDDYDGYWADGPSLDYYGLTFSVLWLPLVLLNEKVKIPQEKFMAAYEKAVKIWGQHPFVFDSATIASKRFLLSLIGVKTDAGEITEDDVRIMKKIWDGPKKKDGSKMAPGFGPNIIQWPFREHPFGYLRYDEKGEIIPFIISLQTIRWMTGDPDWDFKNCTYEMFEKIFEEAKERYCRISMTNTDLSSFTEKNKKLILSHGTGDNVVPFEYTLSYYQDLLKGVTSEEQLNKNVRLFLPEGAGHVVFDWTGPNITTASAMEALTEWVENENAPQSLSTMLYDFETDRVLEEAVTDVFNNWQYKTYIERKKMCLMK